MTWSTRPGDTVTGVMAQNGAFVGMSTGYSPVYRQMIFPMQLASGLARSEMTVNSKLIDLTAQSFFEHSMQNWATEDTSVDTRGFWVYPDVNDAIADCGLDTTEPWNEGSDIGTEFLMSSGMDKKAFCHTSPGELPNMWGTEPAMLASRLRYNPTIGFHTIDPDAYPAWNYDDYAG